MAWSNIHSDILLLVWPFFGILSALLAILAIYFVYVFLHKRDVPAYIKLIFLSLLAPVLLLAPTTLNLTGFNITNCDAYGYENVIFKSYYVSLGVLSVIWIFVMLISRYKQAAEKARKQIVLMGVGMESFLALFFGMTFLASYLAGFGLVSDSSMEMYGLFGMTVFVIYLTILIVEFRTFNVKLLAAQALWAGLVLLVASEFFFVKSTTAQILIAITLFGTLVGGYLLVRSVKREIEQKKMAQKLATELAGANVRLERLDKMKSEFVSIASHQLRSPLTSVRGYISMVLEGSYGEINPKAKEVLMHVSDAARHMALSIEDYLNVSRIEAGNMKYDISDVDLSQLTRDIVTEMLPVGEKRGIPITFETRFPGSAVVKLDAGKTRQIVQNLIDNALKYTKDKGTVRVILRKDEAGKQVFIDVADQGIGIDPEGLKALFEKFERAKNASHTNVSGTGLGLYIARMMARAMDGDITAASEGEGKGSVFTIRFPLNGIESKWIHGR